MSSYGPQPGTPVIYVAQYPEVTVATTSADGFATIVATWDFRIDEIGMSVTDSGGTSGNTEAMVSKNTITTGKLFSNNTLQIAYNSSALYATIGRSDLLSTGTDIVSAGDRLIFNCLEIPGSASENLTVWVAGVTV